MAKNKYKIGYSDIGGIYIGKNINSTFARNHSITIILALSEAFRITFKKSDPLFLKGILIQKDIPFQLQTRDENKVIFIHLDPYSEKGLYLTNKKNIFKKLEIESFTEAIEEFNYWFSNTINDRNHVGKLINKVCSIPVLDSPEETKIDERILKSIQIINENDEGKLSIQKIADIINLSTSRFAHLFKKEIGLPYRKYVLHRKLIKSFQAIHKQTSFTEASFFGGFSDQSHFTRTFVKAFGIKPSKIKK